MRLWVKICGIKCEEDAREAVRLGADAIGFVFVAASPRCVRPEVAAEIVTVLPPAVTPVGVFVDAGREEILSIVERTRIRMVQLHGSESPDFAASLQLPCIKAFRTDPSFSFALTRGYKAAPILLDGFKEGIHGGTGVVADWERAARIAKERKVILSGGLRPSNIKDAIQTVNPWGVDVSSGVESVPGKKDHKLLKELFAAIASAGTIARYPEER